MPRPFLFLLPLVLLGCQPPSPQASVDSPLAGGDPDPDPNGDPYTGHQGTLLLGLKNTPDVSFSLANLYRLVNGQPQLLVNARIIHGQLGANGGISGTRVVGVQADAPNPAGGPPIRVRIIRATPPTSPTDSWRYSLQMQDPSTGVWNQACDEPPLLNPPASPRPAPTAFVLPGTFIGSPGATFYFQPNTQSVSFACTTGVAAKCDYWGYSPAQNYSGTTLAGNALQVSGQDMFLACVKMARADYCGDGIPHTVNGTPIQLYDVLGLRPHVTDQTDPRLAGFSFEAAWASPGRLGGALCLSKLRWQTLPLGGFCPQTLPDPRLDRAASFCEDFAGVTLPPGDRLPGTLEPTMEAHGALLYNDSAFIDVGISAWYDAATQTFLTTSKLLAEGPTQFPDWRPGFQPPFALPVSFFGQPVAFIGAAFNADSPTTIPTNTPMAMLSTYYCPDPQFGPDFQTTTGTPDSPSCVLFADEGFVYASPLPGKPRLVRYYNPTTHRSFTTAAIVATPAGWQLRRIEGSLPR